MKATFAELLAGFSSEMEEGAIYLIKFYPFSTVLSVIVCLGLLDLKKKYLAAAFCFLFSIFLTLLIPTVNDLKAERRGDIS